MPPYCAGAVFLYHRKILSCPIEKGKHDGRTLPSHLQNIWYPHNRHATAMEITIIFSETRMPRTIPTPIKNNINPVSFPTQVCPFPFSYYSICLKTDRKYSSRCYSAVSSSESPPAPGIKRFTKSGTMSRTLVSPS